MVQIDTLSTPECQEGVLSQGGQQREEHRIVHHVQLTTSQWLIEKSSYLFFNCNVRTLKLGMSDSVQYSNPGETIIPLARVRRIAFLVAVRFFDPHYFLPICWMTAFVALNIIYDTDLHLQLLFNPQLIYGLN